MAVPTLREIEAGLTQALLGGDESPAAAAVLGDGLEPGARLQLYRHHVFTTLTATLQGTYPVVCQLVDARFFAYAADQYIRRHPPTGPCLFEYGASFPDFLGQFEPSRPLRYIPDVGRLEWAVHTALHADDAVPVDPARLRGLPEDELPKLTFRLEPSLTFLNSRAGLPGAKLSNGSLVDSFRPASLYHPACVTCYQTGMSCRN